MNQPLDLTTKRFKASHENTSMVVSFNCIDEYLNRDNSVLYIHIGDDSSYSFDKKEMVELRDHLSYLIKLKQRVENKNRIRELKKDKDILMDSIDLINKELEELERF